MTNLNRMPFWLRGAHSIRNQPMNPVNPRQFVDDQFPSEFRPLVATTLKTAYRTADLWIASEPAFQIPTVQWNRGRLVSWAVDFGVFKLVESGALPFDYSWEFFARPTGRYLAIRPSHSVVTISQVVDPTKQPRNVVFRANARVSNSPFFNLPEFEEEGRIDGLPHILLTHGHQSLSFSHLCIPDPKHQNGYRYRTKNLLEMPHEIKADGPPPEDTDTDFENLGLLKEDIAKWKKDHGG
ncbi:hypothetical protein [Sphingomonas flavalba]|uniref:hypothetical protein n=1 Tax=Sphingomonas flavalba TaxID=2559804 RepID=UPI00109E3588|nr:hypothetical protein [Sphingomonas flavalba]